MVSLSRNLGLELGPPYGGGVSDLLGSTDCDCRDQGASNDPDLPQVLYFSLPYLLPRDPRTRYLSGRMSATRLTETVIDHRLTSLIWND